MNEILQKFFLLLLVIALVIALFLVSCAVPPSIKDVEDISTDTKIVFGSVKVYKGDKQLEWGIKFTGSNYFHLTILPPDTNEAITYQLDKDGVFYWALPPGEYTLLGYYWHENQSQRTGHIGAKFKVPKTGGDVYLGTIEFHGNEAFLVPQFQDKYDEISKLYDVKFPARKGKSIKRLFEQLQPLGTFAAHRDVCHNDWGIKCDGGFHGITPLSPEVSQSGFPTVRDLRPEFSWESSNKVSINYDFILYEAASYAVQGAVVTSYMKGRVVAYEEGIKDSYWIPKTPLKPNTKYYWSVRLREGDTISQWSTKSHFTFLIVAMSSGYGQWFQFKTP
jgi:hypothetical protein